ncbi:rod shape-determining protein MreD [Rhizohabitans arisaemae]|uniref:rod shape-determining protein MreD n=1 Tax=Rhizohabitans arisaemae TaxID=2720610 RepID=UPI0024B236AB|nr:rod shape-determining protein MreD [Rhizohabitans arisaemae]
MRGLVISLVVVATMVFQVTVVNRIPWPGGSGPDLVLLAVVRLALTRGPVPGAVIGFVIGLTADVLPPADHLIGEHALAYSLIGYATGRAGLRDRGAVTMILCAAGGTIASAAIGVLLGDERLTWAAIGTVVPIAVAYNVVAGPLVLKLGRSPA